MKTHGTLTKWNDDRGFGFVALPQTREEIFVHISAFPRDGVRPRIGETISFEVRPGPDGRKRAENVQRAAIGKSKSVNPHASRPAHQRLPARSVLSAVGVIAIGIWSYDAYTSARHHAEPEPLLSPDVETTLHQFTCDGRTQCSQMTSCAEAEYFLKHCPGVTMDGNGDGEPCEQQWCN